METVWTSTCDRITKNADGKRNFKDLLLVISSWLLVVLGGWAKIGLYEIHFIPF